MSTAEIYLIAGIIAGFAFLFGRDRLRRRRQLERAERRGLRAANDGLAGLPASLQDTVLFAMGDGGHERNVVTGEVELDAPGSAPLAMTVFDFAFQRDVRGEWAFLDSEPRFRVFSPLTVVAFEMTAGAMPHLLIKRRGQAEKIAEDGWERYKSVADVVRDISSIERAIPVEPPGALPPRPVETGRGMPDHVVWAADAERARAILDHELAEVLCTPRASSHELVVEVLDSLILVYCARDGALDADQTDTFVDTARAVARAIVTTPANDG